MFAFYLWVIFWRLAPRGLSKQMIWSFSKVIHLGSGPGNIHPVCSMCQALRVVLKTHTGKCQGLAMGSSQCHEGVLVQDGSQGRLIRKKVAGVKRCGLMWVVMEWRTDEGRLFNKGLEVRGVVGLWWWGGGNNVYWMLLDNPVSRVSHIQYCWQLELDNSLLCKLACTVWDV